MSSPSPDRSPRVPWRGRMAVRAGRAVASASRLTRLGSGSVIGGRVSLALDADLLTELTRDRGRNVALVSATNGKTTTTRLLTAVLAVDRPVVSNSLGANMPPGHVAALGRADPDVTAVLEVDERWLPRVMDATNPSVVVLLNLSRDQLDRSHEVRKVAERWRDGLRATPPGCVVANADDPLVAWAAMAAPVVRWVGTGEGADAWRSDAIGCPACSGRLRFDVGGWACPECDLRRPAPEVWLGEAGYERTGRAAVDLPLVLPGRVNRLNAVMALAAAEVLGVAPEAAASALASVTDVAGRYRVADVEGAKVRLLLAKNPAGWQEALSMLAPAPQPVVVSINARVADGHDPSWLWDVPFERLHDRFVVATGERRHDLAVRLHYAEVEHAVADTFHAAVHEAARRSAAPGNRSSATVDVAANYTAFQEYLAEVEGRG